MKKIVALFSILIIVIDISRSQQYRTSLNEGQDYTLKLLDIAASIEVLAHSSREIIVDASEQPKVPDKAKGLHPLMTGSAVDNTGIGLNMKIIDDVIAFSGGRASSSLRYQIKIPSNVNLYLYSENNDSSCYIYVNGLSGEVEIDIREGDIKLTDITGPLMVKANTGDITVEFKEVNQESPMSLVCDEGDIDVTLPHESPITFRLKAASGEVFTDLEISEKEDVLQTSFDGLIMKSPKNDFLWTYRFDSSLSGDRLDTLEYRDIQSIYVDKSKNKILIREKESRKNSRDKALQYYYINTKPEKSYVDFYTKYGDNMGNFYLGHDFPLLFGLMYDFTGDINGGGVKIGIRTEQGNIYLRKSD